MAFLRPVAVLTVVLGATVAVSWIVIGGRAAFQGPDWVLRHSWPAIYGLQAVLAAIALYLFVRGRAGALSADQVVLLVVAAWLGELLALTAGGSLLANEIHPDNAWFFWWMATGGPMQPAAATIGGLLGLRLHYRRHRPVG